MFYDNRITPGKGEAVINNVDLSANFGDILSVSGYFILEDAKTYDYKKYIRKAINISLKDGKDIVFEDLFSDKSIINGVLAKTFTHTLAYNIEFSDKTAAQKQQLRAELEENVFKIVTDINKKGPSFDIANSGITVYYDDISANISTKDYGQYFTFPSIYKSSESLYKDDNVGLTNLLYYDAFDTTNSFYINHSKPNDYTYVDVIVSNYDMSTEDRLRLNKEVDLDGYIKKLVSNLKSNTFNYINGFGYMYADATDPVGEISLNLQKCTMNKDYFNNTILKDIINYKVSQKASLDNTYYTDDKNVKCAEYPGHYISFSTKTGKIINNLSDLFVSGYDYQTIIDGEINDYLKVHYIVDEKAKTNIKYSFSSSYLVAKNAYFEITIDYTKFDQTKFK